jgi:hypothetical protein
MSQSWRKDGLSPAAAMGIEVRSGDAVGVARRPLDQLDPVPSRSVSQPPAGPSGPPGCSTGPSVRPTATSRSRVGRALQTDWFDPTNEARIGRPTVRDTTQVRHCESTASPLSTTPAAATSYRDRTSATPAQPTWANDVSANTTCRLTSPAWVPVTRPSPSHRSGWSSSGLPSGTARRWGPTRRATCRDRRDDPRLLVRRPGRGSGPGGVAPAAGAETHVLSRQSGQRTGALESVATAIPVTGTGRRSLGAC